MIEGLNDAVSAQWNPIEKLERQVARLSERVATGELPGNDALPVEKLPPHY